MTREIGWAGMPVRPTFDDFTPRTVEAGTNRAMLVAGKNSGDQFGSAAGKSASSRFGSVFKAGAKAALLGLGAAGAVSIKVGIDAIGLASDLAESENKVRQVFGDSAERIFGFSSRAAEKLGQTNQQARDAAATFGIFAGAAELSDKKAAGFSIKMTKLASDLASFHNTSPDQAIGALGAALRGESEPLRSYGVLLDEAALKAEAASLGLLKPVKNQAQIKTYQVAILEGQKKYNDAVDEHGKKSIEALKAEASLGTARDRLKKATEGTIPPLTQQQKVLAAQSAIFKQTGVAQGDFERTSDGLANRQRILTARLTDAKTELGQGLLPVMEDATGFILDKGVPAVEKFATWFSEKATPAIGDFIDDAKPLAHDILPTIRDLIDDLVGGFDTLAPLAKDVFDGFNDLPDGVKKGLLAGGGLIAAKKLLGDGGKGGGGALSLGAGGLVSATKSAVVTKSGELLADKLLAKFQRPLPVIVVNPGFAAGGAGGKPGAAVVGDSSKQGGAFGKAAGAAMALSFIPVVDELSKLTDLDEILDGKALGDKLGLPDWFANNGPAQNPTPTKNPFDPTKINPMSAQGDGEGPLDAWLAAAEDKAAGFGRELDLIGAKKVEPLFAVPGLAKGRAGLEEFLRLQIQAGKPITPYIRTSPIERAITLLERMNAEIVRNAVPEAGVTGGIGYQHGSGASSNPRAGINFNGPINVQAHDYNDLTRQLQRKTQQAGLGGRPR